MKYVFFLIFVINLSTNSFSQTEIDSTQKNQLPKIETVIPIDKNMVPTFEENQINWTKVTKWLSYETNLFSLKYPAGSNLLEDEFVTIHPNVNTLSNTGISIQTAPIDTTEANTIEYVKWAIEASIALEPNIKVISSAIRQIRDENTWELYLEEKREEGILIYRSIYFLNNANLSVLLFYSMKQEYDTIAATVDDMFSAIK